MNITHNGGINQDNNNVFGDKPFYMENETNEDNITTTRQYYRSISRNYARNTNDTRNRNTDTGTFHDSNSSYIVFSYVFVIKDFVIGSSFDTVLPIDNEPIIIPIEENRNHRYKNIFHDASNVVAILIGYDNNQNGIIDHRGEKDLNGVHIKDGHSHYRHNGIRYTIQDYKSYKNDENHIVHNK